MRRRKDKGFLRERGIFLFYLKLYLESTVVDAGSKNYHWLYLPSMLYVLIGLPVLWPVVPAPPPPGRVWSPANRDRPT